MGIPLCLSYHFSDTMEEEEYDVMDEVFKFMQFEVLRDVVIKDKHAKFFCRKCKKPVKIYVSDWIRKDYEMTLEHLCHGFYDIYGMYNIEWKDEERDGTKK